MERSFWQQENEHTSFDPYGEVMRKAEAGRHLHQQPQQVPITYDVSYDPAHPAADWNGLVPKGMGGRRTNGYGGMTATRTNFAQTEDGIMPAADAGVVDADPRRRPGARRHFSGDAEGSEGGKENGPLIGSIGADDPMRWVTRNQEQMSRMKLTQTDQYTDRHRRLQGDLSKKQLRPVHEEQLRAVQERDEALRQARLEMQMRGGGPQAPARAPAFQSSSRNMLAGLGSQIVQSREVREVGNDFHRVAREARGNARTKDLVELNYTGNVPGYTGRTRRPF